MSHIKIVLLLLTMDAAVVQSIFVDFAMPLDNNIKTHEWIDKTCELNILPAPPPNMCCVNCTCGGDDCYEFGPWCTDGGQVGLAGDITALTTGIMTCTTPQLRRFDPMADYPFTTINTYIVGICPVVTCSDEINGIDESVDKCDNSESYLDDIDSIIPVVDARTGVPYKSKYCAACHGVPTSNMTQWTARVMCNGEFYWPTSSHKIITDVYNSRTCNIIYEAPVIVEPSLKCQLKIRDDCHADVDIACYFKRSARTTVCLLKHSTSRPAECLEIQIDSPNLLLPFSLLLGSRLESSDTGSLGMPWSKALGTSGQLNMTIAESGSFFDSFKNVVRNLTCLPPRELRQGVCYTASRYITGASFNFSMKMLPVNVIPTEEANRTSNCILSEIRELMNNVSQNWIVLASCYMSLANTTKDREPDIQYFVVEIDAVVTDVALDIQVIDKVLELDGTNNTLLSACGHEFLVEIIRRDRLKRLDGDISYNGVDGHMLYKFKNNITTVFPKGFSVLTSMTLGPTLRCPLVTLNISDYEIELFAWGVTIGELSANISRWYIQETYVSDELSSIQICFDTYITFIQQGFASGEIEITEVQVHYSIAIGVISFVCIGLSTTCLLLTLLTYCIFKDMRNQPGVNNMALCVSLICAQLLLQFGIGQKNAVSDWACNTIGILIHFFWLNTVAWMNICCLHCYRVFRNMTEKQNNNFSLTTTTKYIAYSTLFAMVSVVANITSSMLKDDPDIGYGKLFCYISEKWSLFVTFALPTGVILLINIALFIAMVVKVKGLPAVKISSGKEPKFCSVYARLSSLTGCLWIFGYFYMATGEPVLEYLFVIFNASQGVFIFMTFVCNKNCFRKWLRLTSGNSVSIETRSTKVTSSQTK